MVEGIADAWLRLMSGDRIEAVAFVDILVEHAIGGGTLTGTVTDATTVEFVSVTTARLQDDSARAKLRMVCARLAVVFGGASRSPPLLYGGRLVKQLSHRGARYDAAFEFDNSADVRFRLEVAPIGG